MPSFSSLPAAPAPTASGISQPLAGALRSPCRTILVVDDEIGFRRTATIMLEIHGFKVISASNGLEALELLEQNPQVDAVLLDLLMPVMDGENACRQIRKFWPKTSVILTTGFEIGKAGLNFGEQPPDAILQKPFGFADLTRTLALVLQ